MLILKKYDSEKKVKGILVMNKRESGNACVRKLVAEVRGRYWIIVHSGGGRTAFMKGTRPYYDLVFVVDSWCRRGKDGIPKGKLLPFTTRAFLNRVYGNGGNANLALVGIAEKWGINGGEGNSDRWIEVFRDRGRVFDLLYVGTCNANKHTMEVLKGMIDYLKRHRDTRCCMILQVTKYHFKNLKTGTYIKKVLGMWKGLPKGVKDRLLMIPTHWFGGGGGIRNPLYYGFGPEELVNFYMSSKCNVHGCYFEGESRTIHEALLSGCVNIVYQKMVGGGIDFMKSLMKVGGGNCVFYGDVNKLQPAFEAGVKKFDEGYQVDLGRWSRLFSEEYSVERLRKKLWEKFNYGKAGVALDEFVLDDCRDMEFALAAHKLNVPWKLADRWGADVETDRQIGIVKRLL